MCVCVCEHIVRKGGRGRGRERLTKAVQGSKATTTKIIDDKSKFKCINYNCLCLRYPLHFGSSCCSNKYLNHKQEVIDQGLLAC